MGRRSQRKSSTSRRTAVVHRGNDSRRPERLAIHRRSGNRHDLGAWSVCRARLECRLPSPAVGNRPRPVGAASKASRIICHAGRVSGRRSRAAHRIYAPKYLRCCDAIRIVIDGDRAAAFDELPPTMRTFMAMAATRTPFLPAPLTDPTKQRQMAAFFWWTAWAASTNRPGQDVTYTQNWPHEELVGNRPTGGTIVWSVISFVLLLARHRRHGLVFRFAGTSSRSPIPCPDAIRCWACSPRHRREPR